MAGERKQVAETLGLVQLRERLAGRTQKELGKEVGIQQSVLSEILHRWRLPTLEQAVKLAGLGIDCSAWTTPIQTRKSRKLRAESAA